MKIILILLLSFNIYSASDEVRRFKNCYALFTDFRVPRTHSLLSQVKSGQKTGSVACKELLASAFFNSSDTIEQDLSNNYLDEPQKILNKFHLLHKSFFRIPYYHDIPNFVATGYAAEIYDPNVPNYFWSYMLFKPGVQLKDLLTIETSMRAIRYSQHKASRSTRKAHQPSNSGLTIDNTWSPQYLVETGKLVGIKKDNTVINKTNVLFGFSQFEGTNANAHFGAGVLGTQTYMIANRNKWGRENKSSGGLILNRVWSQHVINDFLCRELPVLRITDVQDEVQYNAAFPFRKSASCMQCHATMDPMAGNIRNIHGVGVDGPFRPLTNYRENPTEPPLSTLLPVAAEDSDFYKRPPHGRIKFRSYNGNLVSHNTNNLQELGDFLATTDDFYACTAKRYYRFLTGIDVELFDEGSLDAPILNNTEQFHRNKVIALGQELKSHQSLPKLIEDIIKTDTFLDPSKIIE